MSKKLLLVEDNKAQASHGVAAMQEKGYEVDWVETGRDAIKHLSSTPYDAVLLDLELPDMNGNQITKWIRANEDLKGIPILMLTARDSVEVRVSALEAGADDYLHKPYHAVELDARIKACLRTRSLQKELERKNFQLMELLAKVEKLAITDPLTTLANRRYFTTVIEKEYRRIKRYGTPLSCFMIDIDFFKRINDEHGHLAGDKVLEELSKVFVANLRDADIVARWGGEEFAVLLPQTGMPEAVDAAERLRKAVEGYAFGHLPGVKLTVSIGVSCHPDTPMDSPDMIVNTADDALYIAKQNGRNRVELYRS